MWDKFIGPSTEGPEGPRAETAQGPGGVESGDTTPCRMTGVTLHRNVSYKELPSD